MIAVPDSHRDLLDTEFATLATVGRDGRPQLSEVWFLVEEDAVRLSLNAARQKVLNLQRNPAVSLLILDLRNPHRYLEFRGDAELVPDIDYAFAAKVGAKYRSDLKAMDKPGERRVIVTLQTSRVRAWG